MNNLLRQLRGDEGVRTHAYNDSLGLLTIGVGRLIDRRKAGSPGLRLSEINLMLTNDIEDRVKALTERLPWFVNLDEARQGVLLNMAFQLGTAGLLGFTNTLKLVEQGNYLAAADLMLQSKWAQQTPARAQRMARQMRTGQWQFSPGT